MLIEKSDAESAKINFFGSFQEKNKQFRDISSLLDVFLEEIRLRNRQIKSVNEIIESLSVT